MAETINSNAPSSDAGTAKRTTKPLAFKAPLEHLLLYRVLEFCAAFGISRGTFYALVKRGELRPIKIGKATRVPRAEAERWQRELERRAGIAA